VCVVLTRASLSVCLCVSFFVYFLVSMLVVSTRPVVCLGNLFFKMNEYMLNGTLPGEPLDWYCWLNIYSSRLDSAKYFLSCIKVIMVHTFSDGLTVPCVICGHRWLLDILQLKTCHITSLGYLRVSG